MKFSETKTLEQISIVQRKQKTDYSGMQNKSDGTSSQNNFVGT